MLTPTDCPLELNGAVLIGGHSRRMGCTKATLAWGAETLVERACRVLYRVVRCVTIVGRREAVDLSTLRCETRPKVLHDDPRFSGPLAGIVAALESAPQAEWVVVGCDMPLFEELAIRWLASHHTRQYDVTAARLPGRDAPEPLLAIYSGRAAPVLRAVAERGVCAARQGIRELRCNVLDPPAALVPQWTNVNTPQELAEARRAAGDVSRRSAHEGRHD